MISKQPNTITYKSVVSSDIDGETTETITTTEIKATVQNNTQNLKKSVNGNDIVYRFYIGIFGTEINKLPTFNINDKLTFKGNDYKILTRLDNQKNVEIYV